MDRRWQTVGPAQSNRGGGSEQAMTNAWACTKAKKVVSMDRWWDLLVAIENAWTCTYALKVVAMNRWWQSMGLHKCNKRCWQWTGGQKLQTCTNAIHVVATIWTCTRIKHGAMVTLPDFNNACKCEMGRRCHRQGSSRNVLLLLLLMRTLHMPLSKQGGWRTHKLVHA
eukprot:389955-Pelagomonas_calceolata.AAC.3